MADIAGFQKECEAFFAPLFPGEDKQLVFGEGRADSPVLMLVGEAPGEQEVLKRKPFVGKAGKNLDAFLEIARLPREEIFVTNTVKIRPTKRGASGRVSNRAPNAEELALFIPWLEREIALVAPKAIVTLGNVPLRALMGAKATIGDMHGRWHRTPSGRALFALYHPASIIYRRELAPVYESDVRALAMTIETLK